MAIEKRAPQKRGRQAAKAAGADFNKRAADWLAQTLNDSRIEVRHTNGSKDRGDITALRLPLIIGGGAVVAEVKNTGQPAPYLTETEVERINDNAVAGWVISKRHGISDMGSQLVYGTMRDLAAMFTGVRPE